MKPIEYIVISDIHLGHNKTHTEKIVENLKKYFKDNHQVFKKLDIIFIAGDIFDKLLTNGGEDHIRSMEWLTLLAMYCKHNDIKLRILEGTRSHDWNQSGVIAAMLNKLNMSIDFKYIDVLAIEEMADIDLSILYVPDEWNHAGSDTYTEVLELLKEHKLNKVDICIMHGQFNYQLPMISLESSHDEDNYLDITNYYISIGHIHKHSVNGRILAQGSFDRLSHGEEEPKGAMWIHINKLTNHMEFRFIENKYAVLYKTFNYETVNDTEIKKMMDRDISKLPHDTHVRLMINKDSLINKNKKEIKSLYPYLNITIEATENTGIKNAKIDLVNTPIIDSFHITKNNITDLMYNEMKKHNLSSTEIDIYNNELKSVIDSV